MIIGRFSDNVVDDVIKEGTSCPCPITIVCDQGMNGLGW